jgi:hypothetical protein
MADAVPSFLVSAARRMTADIYRSNVVVLNVLFNFCKMVTIDCSPVDLEVSTT